MIRRWSGFSLLLALLCFISACGYDYSVAGRPHVAYLYLARAQEFVAVAGVLFNEGRPAWGQGIRNIYYSVFTLARMKHFAGFQKPTDKAHDRVWGQVDTHARTFFVSVLKAQRNKYDYGLSAGTDDTLDEDLLVLHAQGPSALALLGKDVRASIARQFSACSSQPSKCGYCAGSPDKCIRDDVSQQIYSIEQSLNAFFTVRIPELLAPADPKKSEPAV